MNQSTYIFIRHAQSAQNLAAQQAINSSNDFLKARQQSQKVKWDPSLIDCGLTEFGIQQCQVAAQTFIETDLDIILVSPLKRAIQTAYYLFKDHPSKPKFIVVPFLREMLSSSCDIGGNLTQTMIEFPQFDYSRVLNTQYLQQNPNIWSLEYIYNQEQKELMKQFIDQQKIVDLNEQGPAQILSYLSQYPPKSVVETYKDMMLMVKQAKEELAYYKNQKYACVTHARFLLTLSATEFDEKFRPIDGIQIKNCDFIKLEI